MNALNALRAASLALTAGVCGFVVLATPANAISRYNTPKMTCEAIQSVVRAESAVLLRHPGRFNPSVTVYDRFVRASRFCERGEVATRASVPAADTGSCRVLRCEPDPFACESGDSSPRCNRSFRKHKMP